MKKYLFIILLFSSYIGKSTMVGFKQKIYPSLLGKNFILIANIQTLWGYIHVKPGSREIYTFEQSLFPVLLRDYVDRNYTFKKNTILYLNPHKFLEANELSVHGDTIFFQFNKSWDKGGVHYSPEFYKENTMSLLDYGINNLNEVISTQRVEEMLDFNTDDTVSLVTLNSDKIRQILESRVSDFKINSFLTNTKKYLYQSEESAFRELILQDDENVSCFYQNNYFHFTNKKNGKVFFKRKNILQFVKIGKSNYLFNLREGLIYNYNAISDILSIISYPELCYKRIYRNEENYNNSFKVELEPFIGYRILEREYTYLKPNELPVLIKTIDSRSFKNQVIQQRKNTSVQAGKAPSKLFIYFSISFISIIVFFFLKANLEKRPN